jgi:hypothetical protein
MMIRVPTARSNDAASYRARGRSINRNPHAFSAIQDMKHMWMRRRLSGAHARIERYDLAERRAPLIERARERPARGEAAPVR